MLHFAVLCDVQVSLSAVASVFDVGIEDVTFHDLCFYQEAQFPIVAEFDLESIAGGDSGLTGKNLPKFCAVLKR